MLQSLTTMRFIFKCMLVILLGVSSSSALFSQTAITTCYMEHSGIPTDTAQHKKDHCLQGDDSHQHSHDEKPHKHCHQHRACCSHSIVFYRHTGQPDTPMFQREPQVFGVAFGLPMPMKGSSLFRPPRLA